VLLSPNEEVEAYVKTLGFTDSEYDTFCIQKIQGLGADIFWDTVRRIVLHVTDTLWMQHLDSMAHLKNSVNLRSYGQRDPIIEYKREGLEMFKTMELEAVNQIKGFITTIRPEEASSAPTEPVLSRAQAQSFKINMSSNSNTQSSQKFSAKEYGRNDKVILVKGGEEKEIKFKKAQEYFDDGWVIKK
jgi:preprotein translocase subunit SecA